MSDRISDPEPTLDPRPVLRAWRVEPQSIRRADRGVTNQTFEVEAGSRKFYLRLYSGEARRDRICYEHQLLQWLQNQPLTFAVPAPIATPAGETFPVFEVAVPSAPLGAGAPVAASRGSDHETEPRYASLFEAIPGQHRQRRNRRQVESAGRALGSLHACLSRASGLPVPGNSATNAPLGCIHRTATDLTEMAKALPDEMLALSRIEAIISRVEGSTAALYEKLPIQVIHSDFIGSNILFDDDQISGILDFEFALPDMRALDFVAGLNSFCFRRSNKDFDAKSAAAFARGYGQVVTQTSAEIESLPELFRLRPTVMLDYCAGRWRQGKASEADVRRAIGVMVTLEDWFSASGPELVQLVRESSQG